MDLAISSSAVVAVVTLHDPSYQLDVNTGPDWDVLTNLFICDCGEVVVTMPSNQSELSTLCIDKDFGCVQLDVEHGIQLVVVFKIRLERVIIQ